jgi:predicted lipoprotein with Yx(FWY)xxD motif
MKRKLVLILAAGALLALAGLAGASTLATSVGVGQSKLGRILIDGHGHSLYLFERDRGGKSSCYGGCAGEWPPLLVSGKPHAKSGVKAGLLGRTKRHDGRWQVTYKGHPLYTFSGDTSKGQTNGEGLDDFGGWWYLVSPAGAKVVGSSTTTGSYPYPR